MNFLIPAATALCLLVMPDAARAQAIPNPDGGYFRLLLDPEDRARFDELIVELRVLNTRLKKGADTEAPPIRRRRRGRR